MPMKDADIHPAATGAAAETVAAHQAPKELVFWSGWFCPFNQRVWMALEERGIDYQYHEVNPYHKSPEFLSRNPLGLVPTLENTRVGKALYESDILVEYIDELVPADDAHPALLPADPFDRAWVRINVQHINKKILPAYFKLQMSQDADGQAAGRAELQAALATLAGRVAGPYFSGAQFGTVDVCLAPFARRMYVLEEHRAWADADVGEGWEAYKAALLDRESLKRTSSEDEYYSKLLRRYLDNEAESEVAKATRGGKALP